MERPVGLSSAATAAVAVLGAGEVPLTRVLGTPETETEAWFDGVRVFCRHRGRRGDLQVSD